MSSLKPKQPRRPTRKTRNLGKAKHAQLATASSSQDSPPSDDEVLPSTKLYPLSFSRAFPPRENMSESQRETRGMFKSMARAMHKMAKMLKKGPYLTVVHVLNVCMLSCLEFGCQNGICLSLRCPRIGGTKREGSVFVIGGSVTYPGAKI
ncbi:hypothetical protein Tco_1467934 [Tanacetum coccineum]